MKFVQDQYRKELKVLKKAAAQGHIESQPPGYSSILNKKPLVGQIEYSGARKYLMMPAFF
jgi:hypothetical protein